MFGRKKKAKQEAEQLAMEVAQKTEEVVASDKEADPAEIVADKCSEMQMEIDQLDMCATRRDGNLLRMEKHAQEALAQQEADDTKLLQLIENMMIVAGENNRLYDFYETVCQGHRDQKDMLYDLMEKSKHYTNITRNLQDVTVKYQAKAKELMSETDHLRQMSEETEDQGLKEQMTGIADAMQQSIHELQESYESTNQEIHQLIMLLRGNNIHLSKLAGAASEQVNAIDSTTIPKPEETIEAMNQQLAQLQTDSQVIIQSQQRILDDVDTIRKVDAQEKESRGKMEELFGELRETVKKF